MGERVASATGEHGAAGCRCVVLSRPGRPAPAALSHGLEKRGAVVTVVEDAATALAEVLTGPAQVLVVDEPGDQPQWDELYDAVRKYRPVTRCWSYRARGARGGAELAPVNGHAGNGATSSERGEGEAKPQAWAGMPGTEAAAANGEGDGAAAVGFGGGDADVDRWEVAPLLTQDELAMLLGPEVDDEAGDDAADNGRRDGGRGERQGRR